MKTNNKISKEKDFDSVQLMRDIRKSINNDIKNMSFAELKEYIKQKLKGKPLIGQAKVQK